MRNPVSSPAMLLTKEAFCFLWHSVWALHWPANTKCSHSYKRSYSVVICKIPIKPAPEKFETTFSFFLFIWACPNRFFCISVKQKCGWVMFFMRCFAHLTETQQVQTTWLPIKSQLQIANTSHRCPCHNFPWKMGWLTRPNSPASLKKGRTSWPDGQMASFTWGLSPRCVRDLVQSDDNYYKI